MKLKLVTYCLFTAVIAFLVSTCSTSSKAIVSSNTNVVVEKEVIKSPEIVVKETPKINYIPDSISEITINLVGDLMCHLPQTKNAEISNGVYDFKPSFEYIKPFLQNADLTIGNLETTFAGTSQPYDG